jgi:hypothetical protein
MRKIMAATAAFLLCALAAVAQGGLESNSALRSTAGVAGTVRVCTAAATGTPCSPSASIYSDTALSIAKANPFATDSVGNYDWYAAPGFYREQVTVGATTYTRSVLVAADMTKVTIAASFANLNNILIIDGVKYAQSSTGVNTAITDASSGDVIFMPRGVKFTSTATITSTGENLTVRCAGDRNDDLLNLAYSGANSALKAASGTALFTFSGEVTSFALEDCTLFGNGSAGVLSTSGVTAFDGRWSLRNLVVKDFGATAFTFANSTYFYNFEDIWFQGNTGALDIGWAADGVTQRSYFYRPAGSVPQMKVIGGSLNNTVENLFVKSSGAGTGADYEVNSCNTSGASGYQYIERNKFGPEGESATRYKWRNYCSSSTTDLSTNVNFLHNSVIGNSSDHAAHFENPHAAMLLDGNYFSSFKNIINDAAAPANLRNAGGSIWTRSNRVEPIAGQATTIFANGGRGFTIAELPGLVGELPWDDQPARKESVELRNRVKRSEDQSHADWAKSGVTVACAKADPWGGTRACTLTRDNAAASENIRTQLDVTSAGTYMEGHLWLKGGTCRTAIVELFDTSNSKIIQAYKLTAPAGAWKKEPYKLPFAGLTAATNYQLRIFPCNTTQVAGDIDVFGVMVSDLPDADYLPATVAMAATTESGNRWELAPRFGRPGANDPFIIESTTATKVENLDADKLDGGDWAAPAAIGTGTPAAGTFTTLNLGGTTITDVISATASLDFTALAANSCEVLTITVTGAADGDAVALGVPTALADVDGGTERTTFFGWVSGADTVSVRRCNVTGSATAEPAAATVRATVTKF